MRKRETASTTQINFNCQALVQVKVQVLALSQETPKLNKSPPQKGTEKDLDQGLTLKSHGFYWVHSDLFTPQKFFLTSEIADFRQLQNFGFRRDLGTLHKSKIGHF